MTLVLARADVERLLPMDECIEAMRRAHVAFSAGRDRDARPAHRDASAMTGLLRAMPAWLDDGPRSG